MISLHIYSSWYAQHNSVYLVGVQQLNTDEIKGDLMKDFLDGVY